MPDTVDIRRVERYDLLKTLLMGIRRRRRLVSDYQLMVASIVRTLAACTDVAELEVSVYDSLHDQQAKRFKQALVSQSAPPRSLIAYRVGETKSGPQTRDHNSVKS